MTTVNYDFTGITTGQELNAFEPLFVKLAGSGTNTVQGGTTAGTLSFVGGSATPSTYAYETNNVLHAFKSTYAATGLSGSVLTCCARIVDYRNCLSLRFSASATLELVILTNATPTVDSTWTVTRGANDSIELIVESGNQIRVKFAGAYLVFPSTGTTTKTITNHAAGTKVGFSARSGAVANAITAAEINYPTPFSLNSVNGGTNSVQIGSSGNTVETTGLTGVTAASIGSVSMISVAGSSSPWTFTCPPLTDSAVSLYPSGTFTIVGTEGSPTLTDIDVSLPAGIAESILSGTLNTTETGVLYEFSPAAVVTDRIFYPDVPAADTFVRINAQGNINTNYFDVFECWHWQASTGITRSYTVDTSIESAIADVQNFTRIIKVTKLLTKSLNTRSL